MSSKSRFRPNNRRYELVWPDEHELSGLVVKFRAMRLGELEKLGSLYDQFQVAGSDDASSADKMKLLGVMVEKLAGALVTWNRMDEDSMRWDDEMEEYVETPETRLLPADANGLRALEDWEFMAIMEAYFNVAVGVNGDLGKDLSSGSPSPVELLMTELS